MGFGVQCVVLGIEVAGFLGIKVHGSWVGFVVWILGVEVVFGVRCFGLKFPGSGSKVQELGFNVCGLGVLSGVW